MSKILAGIMLALAATHTEAMTAFSAGNSLIWDARVAVGLPTLAADAGLELTTGYHIRCNGSLDWISQNPTDVCVAPNEFGYYTEAFADYAWDAITLQPFSGSTPRQEYLGFKSLLQLARQNPDNEDARFYLYASWDNTPPAGVSFYDDWYDTSEVDPDADLARNAKSFQWIFDQLRNDPDLQGVDLRIIPVGDVLAEVDRRMAAGLIPGYTDARQLYRDVTHLNNLGRFIASNTFLATLFSRNPVGVPVNSDFDSIPGQPVPIDITPELAALMQDAAWDVVRSHPYAGALPGDIDGDGLVGITDLNAVLSAWNQNAEPFADGDPDGDGFVGIADLNAVLGNWNAGTPPGSADPGSAAPVVPEPSAIVCWGLLLVVTRRGRSCRA